MLINVDLDEKTIEKLEKQAQTNRRSRKAELEVIIEEALQ